MDTKEIVSQIDSEITRLQQVKSILSGITSPRTKRGLNKARPVVAPITVKKRTLSPEARARIAAAQKARWAKVKKATKTAQKA